MTLRLTMQYAALIRLKKKAVVISIEPAYTLYQVNDNIAPFSFGNSIYINQNLHQASEIEKILAHEIVHVRQRHTLDILWAELLCILNWYNPFAWFIRRSIKENLEFIADAQVIKSGIDKKQYQYLLLQAMHSNHYLLTNQFNFSSLKNRITMMNKAKTAKIQLLKFLFLLPLMGLLLASFRSALQSDTNKVNIFGNITNETKGGPLANVMLVDEVNHLKAMTNSEGHYSLTIPTIKEIKLPIILKVEKAGFSTVSLKLKSLKNDKNGKINSLYTINVGMQPAALKTKKPFTVIVGYQEGTDNYKKVKDYWDNFVSGDKVTINTSANHKLTIYGIIVDENNFKPLKNALVKSETESTTTMTDQNGFYALTLNPSASNSKTINLSVTKAGYSSHHFNIDHPQKAPDQFIANIGLSLNTASNKLKVFSDITAQSTIDEYATASKQLKAYQQRTRLFKQMQEEQRVITVRNNIIYILGKNIASSYTSSTEQKYAVNGKHMSIEQINENFKPQNIINISADTPDDIHLTVYQ